MTKRDWLRIGAGAAAVAVVITGVVLWRDHRESLAKAALAAEIRAERAARPRPVLPPATEEEIETARLYSEAIARLELGFVDDVDLAFFNALDEVPWTAVPKPVEQILAKHAECLEVLDRATTRDACRFDPALSPAWGRRARTGTLLEARGHAAIVRGNPVAAAQDVRRLLRIGREFGAVPKSGETDGEVLWPGLQLLMAEQKAQALLSAIATAPGLTVREGPALLAAANADWRTAETNRLGVDAHEDAHDAYLLRLLDPDAQAWLDEVSRGAAEFDRLMERSPSGGSFLDDAKKRIFGTGRDRVSVPDAEGVRATRELRSPTVAAVRRRDMAALAPGGPLEPVGNLFGFLGPRWFRKCVKDEARIAVARTAAAVRAFQLKEGRPPRDLGEVAASMPPGVTLDPFDGKPLLYEVVGDGWRVASRVWRESTKEKDGTVETDPPVEVRFPRPPK